MRKRGLFLLIPFVFFYSSSFSQSPDQFSSKADSIPKTRNLRTGASTSISNNITRNSTLALPPSKTDSAAKSISLSPGFSTAATGSSFYLGIIVGRQIEVDFPKPNQIIQRNNTNQAVLRISGTCDSSAAAVEVNLIPIQGGTAQSDLFLATNGKYLDSLWITGGDYRLEVKTILRYIPSSNGTTPIYGTSRTVERVGVGEVLLLWGHSFLAGDPSYDEPSSDPRVRTVEVLRNPSIPNEPGKLQDLDALPLVFQPIDTSNIGPFGVHSWMWGRFGDTLAKRLNVPILLYMTAYGGSNVWMNMKNIKRERFGFDWFGGQDQYWMPYRPVEAAFYKYIPLTGLRAVLVEHGGNDVGPDFLPTLYENFVFVINHTRTVQANHPQLAFKLSKEGVNFLNQNTTVVNDKIQQVLNTIPNTSLGIDLSEPSTQGPWRDNGGTGHFRGKSGHDKYLELWKAVVPNSFFTTTTPKPATKPN
ncbi:hypothetical protein [Runella aurantiaca]|uniref:Uncharacterized protein n=1 Tax=Runella aurantiaca TaxID=2282308 RepID=A0A369I4Z8_9BACT|nr:hypothetical protein [Runella aurantiaca]RDB04658.1 hypothetical protein DVG78_16995 [Runella aurantiaca]